MPIINGSLGDTLIIYSKEIKYIDENKTEYFIDGEILVSDWCDLTIYANSLKYYDDYVKQYAPDNVEYHEEYDENAGTGRGYMKYKQNFESNIPEENKKIIINRIKELCIQEKIKVEILYK